MISLIHQFRFGLLKQILFTFCPLDPDPLIRMLDPGSQSFADPDPDPWIRMLDPGSQSFADPDPDPWIRMLDPGSQNPELKNCNDFCDS